MKKKLDKKPAFTLIELLVVIAIIALLSTLSVVALNRARSKARDSRRLSDIKQISTALEMYYSEYSAYPSPPAPANTPLTGLCLSDLGISSTCGTMVYLKKIPGDPRDTAGYGYVQLLTSDSYRLFLNLENNSGDYREGPLSIGPGGPDNDLLLASGIDWRNPAHWNCGANPISYDNDLKALKIQGYAACFTNLISIDTNKRYYLSAEYMTTNDSDNKKFYMGSLDYNGTNGAICNNNNYFTAIAKSTSTNIWTTVANTNPHTGEGTSNIPNVNTWCQTTNKAKLMFLANYSGITTQITYIRNIRFYSE